jgi:hypothetical protein
MKLTTLNPALFNILRIPSIVFYTHKTVYNSINYYLFFTETQKGLQDIQAVD